MTDLEPSDRHKCFYPLLGLASGFFIGWLLNYRLPPDYAIEGRFYMLLFSCFGWAWGVVLRKNHLFCGGMLRCIDNKTVFHNITILALTIPLFIVMTIFLLSGEIIKYYFLFALLGAILVAKVAWNKPSEIIREILFRRE